MEITNSEQFFYACNGAVLRSLDDFIEFLRWVDDGTFLYHVTSEKNDFANWVRDVLKEKSLATKLFHAKNAKEMLKLVDNKKKRVSLRSEKKNVISQIRNAVLNG